jgi:hypothetical protein
MKQVVTLPSAEDGERIEAQRRRVREHFDKDARHPYDHRDEKLRLLQQSSTLDGWIRLRRSSSSVQEFLQATRFQLTMISKRIERGEAVVVRDLFDGVTNDVRRMTADRDSYRRGIYTYLCLGQNGSARPNPEVLS